MESNYEKLIPCKRRKTAYRESVMLRTESTILGSGCEGLGTLESTFQTSLCVVSKSSRSVWCTAGKNSHKFNARL